MANVIRLVSWGGLGDVLLTTPAIRSLKMSNPSSQIVVYCLNENHFSVYKNNPNIDRLVLASFASSPVDYVRYLVRRRDFLVMNYGSLCASLYYKKVTATEVVADMLNVKLDTRKLEVWLTSEENEAAKKWLSQYSNPILVHITSITTENQEWPYSYWEQLIASMGDYTFVQIGLNSEHRLKGAIDLRGKTTFRSALALLNNSLSFAGVVSAFSHATNAFNIPGVVLFGASTPEVWGHDNNINLYKNLPCAPCVDLLLSSRCPYNKPCMREITVGEVRQALLKQVATRTQVNGISKLDRQAASLLAQRPRTIQQNSNSV